MTYNFPKVELHLHIDCSLSFQFVSKYVPGISREDYQLIYNAPIDCCSLNDYLACAKAAIALMQSQEQLYDATLDVIHQLEEDNVVYAELRFAPLQHLEKGLTPKEVVESCLAAVQDYRGKVKVNLILCTLRHFSKAQSDETAELVLEFSGKGVVGLDLAADEAGYGLQNHQAAFQKVRDAGIPCTAHAGEACGPESVWESLNCLGIQRIGHGIRSVEDPHLTEMLKQAKIHLEICPTSNHITQVYSPGTDYPIQKLVDKNLSFSINTDGRAISNVTLEDEYRWLVKTKGWSVGQIQHVNEMAIHAAFISTAEKERLLHQLREGFERFRLTGA